MHSIIGWSNVVRIRVLVMVWILAVVVIGEEIVGHDVFVEWCVDVWMSWCPVWFLFCYAPFYKGLRKIPRIMSKTLLVRDTSLHIRWEEARTLEKLICGTCEARYTHDFFTELFVSEILAKLFIRFSLAYFCPKHLAFSFEALTDRAILATY